MERCGRRNDVALRNAALLPKKEEVCYMYCSKSINASTNQTLLQPTLVLLLPQFHLVNQLNMMTRRNLIRGFGSHLVQQEALLKLNNATVLCIFIKPRNK
jgi:hypothetical protein